MDKNVGGTDRIARILVGVILVIAGLVAVFINPFVGSAIAIIGVIIGAILFITGFTQKCPINQATGINTYKEK